MIHPNEPMLRLQLAQQKIAKGQYESGLRHIDEILSAFPGFGPALHERVKGLRALGQKVEAELIIRQLLTANPFDGGAHHQLAHLLADKGENSSAEKEFEVASDCEPGDARNYLCHGKQVFRTAGEDDQRYTRARELLSTAAEVGGERFANEAKPFLAAVERKMHRESASNNV
jgi:tetratricopeptide (TPR) repeat protein